MNYNPQRALELLRLGSGIPNATFREGQEEAILSIVEGKGRLLVVQKTGWGKSFVYFIATKLLREAGSGPALLVSPLLSLMRNQIEAAERMGVRAETINSSNEDDWPNVEAVVNNNEIDILLIAPERLANESFKEKVLHPIAHKVSLLVIDEAHCISDWGHDFRPDYRRIEQIIKTLPPNLRLLATTATANNRVMDDLKSVLGPDLDISRGDLNRPSLTLQTIKLFSQAERLAWLAERVKAMPGSGIIYTLTKRDAEQVARWLKENGLNVEAYTSDTDDRTRLEHDLLENRVKALVATVALGMGFDKPDLAFVIHYQMPGSVVAYYQQVGRAGRDGNKAYGVLLRGHEDDDIIDYFIKSPFPTKEEVEKVLNELDAESKGLSIPEMMSRVNMSKGRIEKTTKLLSLEVPATIVKDKSKWKRTPTPAVLGESLQIRAKRLTDVRKKEHEQMKEYVNLAFGEHMSYLIKVLDGKPDTVAGPTLPPLPETVDTELAKSAIEYLRRTCLPVEPRKKWPAGGLPIFRVKGDIKPEHQANLGMALCNYGDAGWGYLVKQGKYQDHRFSDELVEASAKMIREWNPQPAPEWVTCVPSMRHPGLVPDFAKRLAKALGLEFVEAIVQKNDRPEQKAMQNSTQQARNLDGTLGFTKEPHSITKKPVLLVDDIVDSRWTLTVCTWLLRQNGCGEVWPMALSIASKSDSDSE